MPESKAKLKTDNSPSKLNAKNEKSIHLQKDAHRYDNKNSPSLEHNPENNQKKRNLSPSFQQKKLYFNSDPAETQKRLESMKKIRQEYSHEKTSQVVKEVEDKIKGWMERQKSAEKKRLHFIQKSLKEEEELERIEKEHKKSSKERLQQKHHEEVMDRLKKLRQKSNRRFEELKNSNVTFKSTVQSIPLYLQKEKEFAERRKEQELQVRQQMMRKRSSLNVNVSEIREHERKYLEEIKERESSRKKHIRGKDKLSKEVSSSYEFVTIFNADQIKKQEEKFKRQRMKDFSESLINLSPDEQTLERIRERRQKQSQDEIDSQAKVKKSRTKTKQSASMRNLSKLEPSQMRKMGNDYLRQAKLRTVSEHRLKNTMQKEDTKLPEIEQPRYKNYLADLKIKPPKALDQIEATKKMYRHQPGEAILEFSKKSQKYEKNMLKMVKELKNIQRKEDYQRGLHKEAQIDEMYNKTLKMRLACLEMS